MTPGGPPDIEIMSTSEQFDTAFGILGRIIAEGADVNAKDSAGNPALMRAVLDARQVLVEPVLIELREDLHRIFDLLLRAGADKDWGNPRTGDRLVDVTEGHPVRRFLPE